MKISVRSGDVQLRSVQAWEHSRGVYTLELVTPFDLRVGLMFGETADKSTGLSTTVDIYAPLKDEPTRVTLTPESDRERLALMGGLSFEGYKGGVTIMQAIPSHLWDRRGGLVGAWELPSAQVDYLEGLH